MFCWSNAAPDAFQRRVHQALKYWHNYQIRQGLLDDLLIAEQVAGGRLLTRRQRTNRLLEHGLEQMGVFAPGDADLLKLRFMSGLPVREVQQCIHYSASMVFLKQGRAIILLSELLYQWELTAQQQRAASETNNWAEWETLPSVFGNL